LRERASNTWILTKREEVMDFADIENDQLRTEAIERYVVWIESLPYRVGRAEQDSIRETIINDLEN
jgi:hypothetical protein